MCTRESHTLYVKWSIRHEKHWTRLVYFSTGLGILPYAFTVTFDYASPFNQDDVSTWTAQVQGLALS